jgi:hypothetical protein
MSNVQEPVATGPRTMVTHVKLNSYDVWLKGFTGFEQRRADAGIRNPRVFRRNEDGNDVVIIFDVDDAQRARDFFENPSVQQRMREGGGVAAPPEIYFLQS